jgi:hypothetical protein
VSHHTTHVLRGLRREIGADEGLGLSIAGLGLSAGIDHFFRLAVSTVQRWWILMVLMRTLSIHITELHWIIRYHIPCRRMVAGWRLRLSIGWSVGGIVVVFSHLHANVFRGSLIWRF